MTWGLLEPTGFGEFFLEGDYTGWDERLRDYYERDMPAEEKAGMGMEERVLFSKFSSKFVQDRGVLQPHECPVEFASEQSRTTLGSLLKLSDRLLAVDEQLKDVIEGLEPGVHQFWPIRITMPGDKEYPTQYHGLRIGRFLDGFISAKSDPGSWREKTAGRYTVNIPKKKFFNGLAVSVEASGFAHLWRDTRLFKPQVFFSDTMEAEISRLGLRLPKYYRMKEV